MLEQKTGRDALGGLMLLAAGGDRAAFGRIYLLSSSMLMLHAYRIVRTRALAEEVLQESFLAIWRDAAKFDCARGAPLTWMAAIVRNKAIDYLRANRLHSGLGSYDEDAGADSCDLGAGPCDAAAAAQLSAIVCFALQRLDAPQRRAIELAFFHDLSHREVAHEMTVPLGTVKTWIRRGCSKLRPHVALCRP